MRRDLEVELFTDELNARTTEAERHLAPEFGQNNCVGSQISVSHILELKCDLAHTSTGYLMTEAVLKKFNGRWEATIHRHSRGLPRRKRFGKLERQGEIINDRF